MKQKFLTFFAIFIMVVIQVSFWPNFFPENAIPDATLILIIIWSSANKFSFVWPKAVLAGLILDLASFNPIGFNILSFLAVSFFSCFLTKRFFTGRGTMDFFVSAGLVLIGAVINFFIINMLFSMQHCFLKDPDSVLNLWQFGNLIIKEAGNLIVFAVIYPLADKFMKNTTYRDKIPLD